jgi:hypothetical protein
MRRGRHMRRMMLVTARNALAKDTFSVAATLSSGACETPTPIMVINTEAKMEMNACVVRYDNTSCVETYMRWRGMARSSSSWED